MSGRRLLIVNADDFGRSPGINVGILAAHAAGIVTSTTLMVNTVWAEDAVRAARAVPALAIGLHLNFCYGAPVSPPADVPSLVDERGGFVTDVPALAARASPDDIRTEASAQLERLRALLGRSPSHLDSHKYVHSLPPIAPIVAELAASWSLPVRATCAFDRAVLRQAGARTPDAFEGRFHGLDGEGVEIELLVALIHEVADGVTELMCHPGYVDEHLGDSSYSADRERELVALRSEDARRAMQERGVRLATFDDL